MNLCQFAYSIELAKSLVERLRYRYIVNKLDLLATIFWQQATSHFDTSVKCTLSYWLAELQHVPCVHK